MKYEILMSEIGSLKQEAYSDFLPLTSDIDYFPNLIFPFGYTAENPNNSSTRSNWLYFAMRSVRLALPVLICPQLSATAKSEMVVSSVSPLRWLMMVL